MGLGKKKLPVGMQVLAARYNDRLCIEVAEFLAKSSYVGYMPPMNPPYGEKLDPINTYDIAKINISGKEDDLKVVVIDKKSDPWSN